jgi:thiamine-phosphate pyrophosphorylase
VSRRRVDLSLYLIVDPEDCGPAGIGPLLESAIAGGVTAVQLRQKQASTRQAVAHARRVRAMLEPRGIALVVNDRVDVALAAGIDAVHVGQDDMDPHDVRRVMGPDAIIGLSLWEVGQSSGAEPAIVDYVGIGPVFPTQGKLDAVAPLGIAGFREIQSRVRVPAVAIGGIDATNVASVVRAGADGVAVITAICRAVDPRAAAHALANGVRLGRSPATALA